jgi:hypothetical protein
MNEGTPDLDDLIRAHRDGVRLTSEQHGRNRARLLSRVAAGAAATAAIGTTSTAVAATTGHGTATLLVKVVIGLVVASGAGAVYYIGRSAPAAENRVVPTVVRDPATDPLARHADNSVSPVSPAEPPANLDMSSSAASEANGGATSSRRVARPKTGSASSLAAEIQLMHDVETALQAGQFERALRLLDDRGGSTSGALGEERAAARVVTLCKLGRVDEARAEAARFIHDRPRSPLVERMRSTCAKGSEATPTSGAR